MEIEYTFIRSAVGQLIILPRGLDGTLSFVSGDRLSGDAREINDENVECSAAPARSERESAVGRASRALKNNKNNKKKHKI